MENSLVGAALACAGGFLVALLNDRLSRAVYMRSPAALPSFFVVRQLINVLYLAALYFLAEALPWGLVPLLIGGAIGITVPSIFFALRMAKRNGEKNEKNGDNNAEEEGNTNG